MSEFVRPNPESIILHGGKTGDRWRVLDKLAEGGQARVHYAEHVDAVGVPVVAKLPHDPTSARFKTEAEIHQRLQSPYVIDLHDFKSGGENPYMILERAEKDLVIDVFEGGMSDPSVLSAVNRMCRSIEWAHENEIAVKDIKRANFRRTPHDTIKLTDFGIAAPFGYVDPAGPIGSPISMAPEHFEEGSNGMGTPESDLYSLALVLWESATGFSPYGGLTNAQIAHEKQASFLRPYSDFLGVKATAQDRAAAEVIFEGTQRNPADRQKSVGHMRRQLNKAVRDAKDTMHIDLGGLKAPKSKAIAVFLNEVQGVAEDRTYDEGFERGNV